MVCQTSMVEFGRMYLLAFSHMTMVSLIKMLCSRPSRKFLVSVKTSIIGSYGLSVEMVNSCGCKFGYFARTFSKFSRAQLKTPRDLLLPVSIHTIRKRG